jgi:hypothetical protein
MLHFAKVVMRDAAGPSTIQRRPRAKGLWVKDNNALGFANVLLMTPHRERYDQVNPKALALCLNGAVAVLLVL